MARKRDLANKLSQDSGARPGWRDAITGPAREEEQEEERETTKRKQQSNRKGSSPLKRKTYLLTPGLIDQIADLADQERVGINELVRYLLRSSLEMIETGELGIPTKPDTRRIVRR